MEERSSAQKESTREAQGGIPGCVVLAQDEALKLNRRPLSRFPQNATVTPKSGSPPIVVPIHGASTEVEFACKMHAFVYTIGAMVPVVPHPRQRGRGAASARPPRVMLPSRRIARGSWRPLESLSEPRRFKTDLDVAWSERSNDQKSFA
jgi:hypothetical protein